MKRDPDLVRTLLLALEAREANGPRLQELPDHPSAVVWYHLKLMKEAGLIDAAVSTTKSDGYVPRVTAYWLTWEGHEFLDATREPSTWERVKRAALESSAFSFRALRDAAIQVGVAFAVKKVVPK